MSLFLEDLLANIKDDVLKSTLKSAMIIRANNVSEYLYLRSERNQWLPQHFPNVAPPAPHVWIEWRFPSHSNNGGKILPLDPGIAGKKGGALLSAAKNIPSSVVQNTYPLPTGGWYAQGILFIDFNKDGITDPYKPLGTTLWMIGRLGELLYPKPNLFGILPGKQINQLGFQNEGWQEFKDLLVSSMYVPWLTLSFLHCKNVSCEKTQPASPALLKKHQQASIPPPIRFHVLKIGLPPMRQHNRTIGETSAKGFHICRGHFKTFDKRPMFGKLRGTWWWPMGVKGSQERWVILKEYELVNVQSVQDD